MARRQSGSASSASQFAATLSVVEFGSFGSAWLAGGAGAQTRCSDNCRCSIGRDLGIGLTGFCFYSAQNQNYLEDMPLLQPRNILNLTRTAIIWILPRRLGCVDWWLIFIRERPSPISRGGMGGWASGRGRGWLLSLTNNLTPRTEQMASTVFWRWPPVPLTVPSFAASQFRVCKALFAYLPSIAAPTTRSRASPGSPGSASCRASFCSAARA